MQNGTCGKHLGLLGSGSFQGLFMVLVWICHMINPICEVVAGLLVGASGHLESNKTRKKIVTLCLPYPGIGVKWEDQGNGYCTGMSMLCESDLFRKEANWANSVSDMQEKLPSHSPEGTASDADTVAAP